jgi:signal transduction histidine kinase
LVVAVLVGISRRQSRVAVARERELLEERAHTAALGERSRIARDIHDVLAHSLGGLVLQLDAVDALLESGKTTEAHARVTAARGLAADGLEEARRAVDALRDPNDSANVAGAIEELVVTHRSLGADGSLTVTGDPGELSPDASGALRRAAQEVLSNARRHAVGEPTALSLDWAPDAVTLTASTPLASGAPGSSTGGGRGLVGLRERVAALGGTASWAVHDGAFVVTAQVPR